MLILFITCLMSSVSGLYLRKDAEYTDRFFEFIDTYGRVYDETEYDTRYEIFRQNLIKIDNYNLNNNDFTMAMNQFGDMTADEFKTHTACYNSADRYYRFPRLVHSYSGDELPTEVDWVSKGAVDDVHDQAQCGSCWAFSVCESLTGSYFIKTGNLVSFSEQQLVDCSTSYGNMGCQGGEFSPSYEYVEDNGICKESDYSYTGTDGKCKKCTSVTKITSYVDVAPNDVSALEEAVVKNPVSIAIEAEQMVFQFFSKGVISSGCGTNLDHGVLVTGYGTDKSTGKKYWRVKNSWGSSWGDNGYVNILRDDSNMCGVLSQPSYPVI